MKLIDHGLEDELLKIGNYNICFYQKFLNEFIQNLHKNMSNENMNIINLIILAMYQKFR